MTRFFTRAAGVVQLLFLLMLMGMAAPALAQDAGLPGPSALAAPVAPLQSASSQALPASVPAAQPGPVSPQPGAVGATDENYRLGSGDKMHITVYGEDDLSGDFLVDGSGGVQVPLVGNVPAAGKTVHQFVADLTAVLAAQYLRDPKVSVEITTYRPFYIIGEVNKPGEYAYESNLDILSAVALAGGFTYRANDNRVMIRRNGASQEQEFPATPDTKIYPGDTVRIRERIF